MVKLAEEERDEAAYLRVSVRLGDFEVEIEGTYENVKSLMGEPLYAFIRGLQGVSEELPEAPPTEEVTPPTMEYPPPVRSQPTLSGTLRSLMDTDWGRKPRTLSEIMTALETSGIYYSSGTVSRRLLDLVKQGNLRRLGTRGSFKYVAAR